MTPSPAGTTVTLVAREATRRVRAAEIRMPRARRVPEGFRNELPGVMGSNPVLSRAVQIWPISL